jgi:hypothetical protein
MLFNPTAHQAIHRDNEERMTELNMLVIGGLASREGLTVGHPVVADYFFDELSKALNWTKIKKAGLRLAGYDVKSIELQEKVEDTLGVELPLSSDSIHAMLDEVKKFQWIEAERAGRNIWAEHNASDPQAPALREWFRRHFGAWYLARKSMARA